MRNGYRLMPCWRLSRLSAPLRKAIAANKALAELKGVGKLIPNQSVLIHAIGLQEAKLLTIEQWTYLHFQDGG